jgi:hypothetical protein
MPSTDPHSCLRLLYLMHSPVEVTLPNGSWGYACDICGNYGFPCDSQRLVLAAIEATNG